MLRNNVTPGSDRIVNEMLKNNPPEFYDLIADLFNKVASGPYPEDWGTFSLKFLHKPGKPVESLDGWRTIAISKVLEKWYASWFGNRLTEWAEQSGKLPDEQYGFRKHRRTTDPIFILQTLIELAITKGIP